MYSYCNFSVIKLVLAGLASIGNAFIVYYRGHTHVNGCFPLSFPSFSLFSSLMPFCFQSALYI